MTEKQAVRIQLVREKCHWGTKGWVSLFLHGMRELLLLNFTRIPIDGGDGKVSLHSVSLKSPTDAMFQELRRFYILKFEKMISEENSSSLIKTGRIFLIISANIQRDYCIQIEVSCIFITKSQFYLEYFSISFTTAKNQNENECRSTCQLIMKQVVPVRVIGGAAKG